MRQRPSMTSMRRSIQPEAKLTLVDQTGFTVDVIGPLEIWFSTSPVGSPSYSSNVVIVTGDAVTVKDVAVPLLDQPAEKMQRSRSQTVGQAGCSKLLKGYGFARGKAPNDVFQVGPLARVYLV